MLLEILHSPLFFYSVVLLTSTLSAAIGVGGSIVLIPLATLQFGVKESVGILTIYFLFQNLNKIAVFHEHIDWKIGWKVALWSLPGVFVGSLLLGYIPVEFFKKFLAGIILLYLANDVFSLVPKKHQPETMLPALSMGYGFLSGLVGSGNLVKGPLFLSLGLRKETYLGTYAFTSLFVNIPKIILYEATGIIDATAFLKAIPFIAISIVGTFVGKRLLKKIPHNVFYFVITASFALSALALLFE